MQRGAFRGRESAVREYAELCVGVPGRHALHEHVGTNLRGAGGEIVEEARDRGWDRLTNGELLRAAEAAGFEILVTTDRNGGG